MPLSSEEIDHVVETLEIATEENRVSSARAGQVVNLPADGEIWVTGDLHDHRRNFEKFVAASDLAGNPQRHVVLHEIIHGEHYDENRAEDSWRMLVRAASLKCDHSSQVHFLFANHDLAQIHGEGIMKGGMSVCEAFNAGVKRDFGSRRASVQVAITEFLLSLPLAIRTGNGLFISHSLPGDDEIATFDYTVFDRALTGEDYRRRTGPVYQLVWGRKASPESAAAFADRVGAQLLITGHQPQEAGYAVNGDRHLIIASDHNQGVFMPLSLRETYDMDRLVRSIRKFVSLELPTSAPPTERHEIVEQEVAEQEVTDIAPTDPGPGEIDPTPEPAGNQDGQPPHPNDSPGAAEVGQALPADPLPTEGQRAALAQMIAAAFAEIRAMAAWGKVAQAADLAGVFQEMPREIYGWGRWDRQAFRGMLESYQQSYPAEGQEQPDYVAWFDQIMSAEPSPLSTGERVG